MRYPIPDIAPQHFHSHDIEVERSRFLCWLCHAPDMAAAEWLLGEARTTHPEASHHCSAFIAGPPGEQIAIGFSDDGEPGGTAGRPMFQALEGSQLGQIAAVVTRYFGGTKLGTGGLVRAYTRAVLDALETLPRRDFIERRPCIVHVDFSLEADARHWLGEHDVTVDGADYGSDGVTLTLAWPSDDSLALESLKHRLKGRMAVLAP
ncbi:IMPACT family protein [Salinicola rhizosphaerae]|uniref:IMPACT family protein n=1 Tax=Salinicola rhizosphaerae TaxID=1443141 RepID=A0ABQ3E1Q7_9GAMM|nr:YigZ family protein [Salinicola rhizosphaerae]GHB20678.1 hypothetical protein GCM10009038_19290 [Salinicola rhizosphaerae]